MLKIDMTPESREKLITELHGLEGCPYSRQQISELVDVAHHAMNEAIGTIHRVTRTACDPDLAMAHAILALEANATAIASVISGEPNDAPCDCPGCQMRRELEQVAGAEVVEIAPGITAISIPLGGKPH